MEMKEKLDVITKESKEYLESMSALELMEDAASFARDLDKLIASKKLPTSILVGCLMSVTHGLSTDVDNILLDARLTQAFGSMRKYVDASFMKKE